VKVKEARLAITAILESIDKNELPKPKIEKRDGETVAWFGGRGHQLGKAFRNGVLDPDVHRSHGVFDAIEGEAMARLDAKYLAKERKAAEGESNAN
jgi:hypothetical protein